MLDISAELETSAVGADVPEGIALMEQIAQCDNILMYEGNGYNRGPCLQPANEVNYSEIAALLHQSKSLCTQPSLAHKAILLDSMRVACISPVKVLLVSAFVPKHVENSFYIIYT